MLSRLLSAPFVLLGLFFLYLTWENDPSWSIYIVPNVVALAMIYVFSPQVNYWWAKRNIPEMPPKLQVILSKQYPFYMALSEKEQKRFRDRIMLYTMANEFMPQKMPEIPPDLQALVASNVVQLTFGKEDFLLPAFEHIILYPRPFPSPQYPTNFHASEIFAEDKVLLFALEQLVPGTTTPKKHYNIGMHEYVRAYIHMYSDKGFPKFEESDWSKLEEISGWSKDYIFKHINRPDISIVPVSVCHFFIFGAQFKSIMPEAYEAYKKIFNMDPVNTKEPVVDSKLLTVKQARA